MKNSYLTLLLFFTAIAGAQIVNIPDANLKARLIYNGYDTNADNEIQVSEAQAVTGTVNLNQSFFTDMTGIEAFTNMQYLYCEQNSSITSVSLSNMPNLKAIHLGENANLETLTLANLTGLDTLKCNNGKLMALDLSTSPGLKSLNCNNNFITSLNVSSCTQLKQLFYGSNQVQPAGLQLPAGNVIEALDCGGNGLSSFNGAVYPNLKVLNCGSNAMNTLTISGVPNLEELYVTNNQIQTLTLDPGMTALRIFECPGNPQLATLDMTPFTNLERLYCGATGLTSLNVTGLTNLTWLHCGLTNLTSLDVSTLANLKMLGCGGTDLTSVDVSNHIHLEELYCNNEFMTTLNIANTPALRILDCQTSQIASLDLTGCPNLEQLNCGFIALGALDLSPVPNLTSLVCRNDELASLDISMLPNLTNLSCENNSLTTLDCSNNHELTWLTLFANNLQTLFIKNGSQEYFDNANWTENPDLEYICADEFQIASLLEEPGMDAVSINTYCSFEPGTDHNTVTGTVRFDADDNGCDATDFAIPFLKIDVTDSMGNGAVYSNQEGVYAFYTEDMGCSLWPNFENPSYFTMFLPVGVSFPAMNSTVTQDFCVVAEGVHPDLEIAVAPVVPARPGFEAVYKIVIRNKGNQIMSLPLGYSFHYNADLMGFVQATTTPDSQGAGLLQWNYGDLLPFESRSVEVVMQINAPTHPTHPVNVNDQLAFAAVIESLGDEMPDDNAFEFNQTVIGSYDPNNLICLEGDLVSTSEIGNYLHYIANFENTGTDAAVNVVVKTVFDPAQVDINTLRIMDSSDPVQIRVNGTTAEYIFQDINLAIGGHGNILLKIKSNNSLVNGDSVINRADIFFDYNLPVTTNDAETVYQMLGVPDAGTDHSIAIFPNPTSGVFNVKANTDIQSVQLYDIQGRLLQTAVRDEAFVTMDISDKQNGVYFLKAISEKGTKVQKIIKE